MNCGQCVFYGQLQHYPVSPPCPSCSSDPTDKGYCVAVRSETGYTPVVTKIFDEKKAREIIRRGMRHGTRFMLLSWSVENRAFQHIRP